MTRRLTFAVAGLAVLGGVLFFSYSAMRAQRPSGPAALVEIYKTPTCGCCGLWVEHLRQNGFEVRVTDLEQEGVTAVKTERGVPQNLYSCHTGVVDGYVVEGHVPAAEVHRLLKERPAVAGIAVAGMPIGSPGMEVGTTVHPYDVVAFGKDGGRQVFASYGR